MLRILRAHLLLWSFAAAGTAACSGSKSESRDQEKRNNMGGDEQTPGAGGLLAAAGGDANSGGQSSGSFSDGGETASAGGTTNSGGHSSNGGGSGGLEPLSSGGLSTSAGGESSGGADGAGETMQSGGKSSAGGAPTAERIFPESVAKPKIMIVGDSIAAGPGCFKQYLLDNLTDEGISNFEFVGEYSDDCGSVRHSAVSCSTANNYTEPSFMMSNCSQGQSFPGISQLMPSHNPDMILLQLGVNDMWGGNTPHETVLAHYDTLIEQMRAHNPRIVIVVAQIHKINTINCGNGSFDASAEALVKAVPAWATGVSTEDSPLFVADLWTNSFVDESNDCVHPDDAGAARMGENWFNAIFDLLN